ncbi:hypothetical protein SEA_GARDENSTATE_46 [Microbacterium phage GardenState]|uniref:Uncharacterized protein n=2 Tax=Gardenstatevirus TaxID=3425012 RepID=A0A4Y6E729_9CAUD|nr:hypothetical protein SEA_IAMGROOT_46 [Microbacterium phage IAmGroot]QOI66958.1 hypothetical protein SEA_GARDENSTATE_46 [Microbacterium phage GardenState]
MAKHIVTEEPYFLMEGITYPLAKTPTVIAPPAPGSTVDVLSGPDDDGDFFVLFGSRHFAINGECLAEVIE